MAAFDWMRLRLMHLAGPSAPVTGDGTGGTGSAQPGDPGEIQGGGVPADSHIIIAGSPVNSGEMSALQVTEAAEKLFAAEKADPPPAMVILSQKLGLSRFEQEILLLCAAFELDTRFAGLFARAHDDAGKAYPTFGLALAISDEPAWDALSPHNPLRHLHLLEINQPPAQPLTASALRIDERILNYIKGLNDQDERLMSMLVSIEESPVPLPPSQDSIAANILREIRNVNSSDLPLIELAGTDSKSKQLVASRVARELDLELYRLPVETLPNNAAELETLARLWQREILLRPVAIYLDAGEVNFETQPQLNLQRFISQQPGLLFLHARDAWSRSGENVAVFDVSTPNPAEQKEAWIEGLAGGGMRNGREAFFASRLANQFNLNLPVIHRIAQNARAGMTENDKLRDTIWEMCLSSTRPRLDMLAQRVEPMATWDDIVLPATATQLLEKIVEQVMHRGTVYDDWGFRDRMNRGLGVSALFAGESGTGKTMAAEVIANELNLNLYRIDLSAVVSKYIGETEKNLRRLFDAAEEGGAILFFDEADAIFGKRTNVKESHDRYANIEIDYLLQRLESYRGLAILATNMKSALDTAFLRRLRFIVPFQFPGKQERAEIWRKVFPPQTPKAELDYERLGNFNLSGGSIINIALSAAFRAANGDPPIVTMPLIVDSIRTEYNKLGLPINEADFVVREEGKR
jgi:ATP-dependent 26S proteasome regulatory subunit